MQKCRQSVGAEWEFSAEISALRTTHPSRVPAERQTERMEFLWGSVELTNHHLFRAARRANERQARRGSDCDPAQHDQGKLDHYCGYYSAQHAR
jgi:hypothetical protein